MRELLNINISTLYVMSLYLAITTYEPKILIFAGVLAWMNTFSLSKYDLQTIIISLFLTCALSLYFLINVGLRDILIYYMLILLPIFVNLKFVPVQNNKKIFFFVLGVTLIYRIDDYLYLIILVKEYGVFAWSHANLSQFTDEGIWSLNRYFSSIFFMLIFAHIINIDVRLKIAITSFSIFLVIFYFSRLLIVGILISLLINLSKRSINYRRVSIIIASLCFFVMTFISASEVLESVAVRRLLLLLSGDDNRVGILYDASACWKTLYDFMFGILNCASMVQVSDFDSLFSDFLFRGGFLMFIIFFAACVFWIFVKGQTMTYMQLSLVVIIFLVSFNYDASMTKPEFWTPFLFTILLSSQSYTKNDVKHV